LAVSEDRRQTSLQDHRRHHQQALIVNEYHQQASLQDHRRHHNKHWPSAKIAGRHPCRITVGITASIGRQRTSPADIPTALPADIPVDIPVDILVDIPITPPKV